jgi:NADPH:quinone reductase-like Zn-dependent oxidoreductase
MLWTARVGTKRAIYSATGLRSVPERLAIVDKLTGLIEGGQPKSVTDRSYPLDQVAQAHAYVEKRHKTGNVVITP